MTTFPDQTVFADPGRGDGHRADGEPGDCYRTCLAIIADTDPSTMPNFGRFWLNNSWWFAARLWAQSIGRDLGYYDVDVARANPDWLSDLVIGSGPSPRGNFDHCVILDRHLELVHDPHPSRAGLVKVEGVDSLMPCPLADPIYVRALPAPKENT